jgi:hypothetical protein
LVGITTSPLPVLHSASVCSSTFHLPKLILHKSNHVANSLCAHVSSQENPECALHPDSESLRWYGYYSRSYDDHSFDCLWWTLGFRCFTCRGAVPLEGSQCDGKILIPHPPDVLEELRETGILVRCYSRYVWINKLTLCTISLPIINDNETLLRLVNCCPAVPCSTSLSITLFQLPGAQVTATTTNSLMQPTLYNHVGCCKHEEGPPLSASHSASIPELQSRQKFCHLVPRHSCASCSLSSLQNLFQCFASRLLRSISFSSGSHRNKTSHNSINLMTKRVWISVKDSLRKRAHDGVSKDGCNIGVTEDF